MTRYERAYSDLTALVLQDHAAYLRDLKASHDELIDLGHKFLPTIEAAEDTALIGHEGCLWDVEILRAALKAAEALR